MLDGAWALELKPVRPMGCSSRPIDQGPCLACEGETLAGGHSADDVSFLIVAFDAVGIEETREQNGDSLQVPKSQGCNQGRQPVRAAEMPSTFPVVEMAEDNDVRLWNRGLATERFHSAG
ncbi:hypothetical protein BDFG_04626 [Blastomyces dermatitidis ATCC 26199]|nr:hypothetical protein BDFG_04626 [Blastomyces dermatitidis ATCC 26199]